MELTYTGQTSYRLEIVGLTRDLPVVQVADNLWIASFVMLGDVTLVNHCARLLGERLEDLDFDYLVGPEAKVLPLLQAVATYLGHERFIVCRKSAKAYMKDPLVYEVRSITTSGSQKLVLDSPDAERIRGKKVVILDDVVSTGGTFKTVRELALQAGAEIVAQAAVLKEGDAFQEDLIYLQDLPLFIGKG